MLNSLGSRPSHTIHELFEVAASDESSPADFDEEKLLSRREAIERRATEAGEAHHFVDPVGQSIVAHRFCLGCRS